MAQGGVEISMSLSSEQALDFVRKLGEDDDFRRRLRDNPARTLRRYGISLPKQHIRSVYRGLVPEWRRRPAAPRPKGPTLMRGCLIWAICELLEQSQQ
jgi:hypothetical protein